MSPIGCLGWAVVAAAWGVSMFSEAVKYSPVTTRAEWILGGAFAVVLVTAIGDSIYYRRRS